MPALRRDSFTLLRESMRWRVALVLSVLIFVLMMVLGTINTRLDLPDTAQLAWIVLGIAGACIAALLTLPRHLGGTVFFVSIALLLAGVMAFGLHHGRPMQHWAYIFPPVIVFLMRSDHALAVMIAFGAYASAILAPLVPVIDVVRFASGYGLLVCFMYTYALLQERAAVMMAGRGLAEGQAVAECLRQAIAAADFQGVAITASIGVSQWRRGDGSVTAALDRADRCLYEAKRGGRNRVVADGLPA